MSRTLIRKLILFITGYCLYIAIEVTFRGYSYILMGICGGTLFILLDIINEVLPWSTDLILQGCIGSSMITATELLVGETLKYCNIPAMWDYSDQLLNYDGVICLPFSVLWIGVSILGIIIADAINYYMFNILPIPYYNVFGQTVIKFRKRG